jgi:hypothetical protein
MGVNPATDSVDTVSAILLALNRLVDAYEIPRRPAISPISQGGIGPLQGLTGSCGESAYGLRVPENRQILQIAPQLFG